MNGLMVGGKKSAKDLIEVLGNKVAVEVVKHEKGKTASGLHLPESAQDNFNNAVVIAIGDDVERLRVGDKVIMPNHAGQEVNIATVEPPISFVIMREQDVLCIVK